MKKRNCHDIKQNIMKQYKFYLSLLTALVFLSLNAKPQEQVQVAYGESIENIILNVDKLLKDSKF